MAPLGFGRSGVLLLPHQIELLYFVCGAEKRPASSRMGADIFAEIESLARTYARPALRRMGGFGAPYLPTATATLSHDMKKADGLTEFIRCRLERRGGALTAASTGTQSSSVLSSMSQGQALIIAPAEEKSLREGATVRVMLLDTEAASEEAPF